MYIIAESKKESQIKYQKNRNQEIQYAKKTKRTPCRPTNARYKKKTAPPPSPLLSTPSHASSSHGMGWGRGARHDDERLAANKRKNKKQTFLPYVFFFYKGGEGEKKKVFLFYIMPCPPLLASTQPNHPHPPPPHSSSISPVLRCVEKRKKRHCRIFLCVRVYVSLSRNHVNTRVFRSLLTSS